MATSFLVFAFYFAFGEVMTALGPTLFQRFEFFEGGGQPLDLSFEPFGLGTCLHPPGPVPVSRVGLPSDDDLTLRCGAGKEEGSRDCCEKAALAKNIHCRSSYGMKYRE